MSENGNETEKKKEPETKTKKIKVYNIKVTPGKFKSQKYNVSYIHVFYTMLA